MAGMTLRRKTSVDIGHCPVHVRGDETEDPKGPVHQHRAFSIPGSGRALSTVAGTIRNETTWTAEISEVFQGTSNGRVSANPLISNSILLVRDEGVVGSNPITPTKFPALSRQSIPPASRCERSIRRLHGVVTPPSRGPESELPNQ